MCRNINTHNIILNKDVSLLSYLNNNEYDLLLMSNTTTSKEVQDKVDYFFYDKRNQLFKEKYSKYDYVNYWTQYDWFKVSNCFPHTQNHGLSVLISLFRSVKIAKELGYTHFYKMEYDARITEKTKIKIKDLNNECVLNNKKGIFLLKKNAIRKISQCRYIIFSVKLIIF